MGAATLFFGLLLPNPTKMNCTPLIITGLVMVIATYCYVRLFNFWVNGFELKRKDDSYAEPLLGLPSNDAYRYADWSLTVPLLLIELILVMRLPAEESASLCWKPEASSTINVALGYPGVIQNDLDARWFWCECAMTPFAYVVITLVTGLVEAMERHPSSAQRFVTQVRYLTAIFWLTYPFVYFIKSVDISAGPRQGHTIFPLPRPDQHGPVTTTWVQVGYPVADFYEHDNESARDACGVRMTAPPLEEWTATAVGSSLGAPHTLEAGSAEGLP
jgi:hypothetical protein